MLLLCAESHGVHLALNGRQARPEVPAVWTHGPSLGQESSSPFRADSENRMPSLATIPTVWPQMEPKPVMSVLPYSFLNSSKREPSKILASTPRMSQGCLVLDGTIPAQHSHLVVRAVTVGTAESACCAARYVRFSKVLREEKVHA